MDFTGLRYLVLFGPGKYNITCFFHNYARIKLVHMILCLIIKSVFNINQNHYYCIN